MYYNRNNFYNGDVGKLTENNTDIQYYPNTIPNKSNHNEQNTTLPEYDYNQNIRNNHDSDDINIDSYLNINGYTSINAYCNDRYLENLRNKKKDSIFNYLLYNKYKTVVDIIKQRKILEKFNQIKQKTVLKKDIKYQSKICEKLLDKHKLITSKIEKRMNITNNFTNLIENKIGKINDIIKLVDLNN